MIAIPTIQEKFFPLAPSNLFGATFSPRTPLFLHFLTYILIYHSIAHLCSVYRSLFKISHAQIYDFDFSKVGTHEPQIIYLLLPLTIPPKIG
jgi:hypothetical protein